MHLLLELELVSVRLINNRIYLDYNATSPLAKSVYDWFTKGDLPFGNPSSIHSSGKKSKRLINESTDYLKAFFNLKHFDIFFHSGATEGINDIFKGFAFKCLSEKKKFHIVCLATDHSCIINQKEHIELMGGEFHVLEISKSGEVNTEEVIKYINELSGEILINCTLVNNETGVIWPLDEIVNLKAKTNCLVHVDAVQMIGRLPLPYVLSKDIDFYTFSGHKFGAMKGVGFTFVKDGLDNWTSLIRGGGQQMAMRSGTENVHGIYSLKLALVEFEESFNYESLLNSKQFLENSLVERFGEKIRIISKDAKFRNANTIYLIIDGAKTDILITACDMAGIDLSSGSACSSGAIKPSRVLMSMGYSEACAKSSIRLSLPYQYDLEQIKIVSSKLIEIFSRFIK